MPITPDRMAKLRDFGLSEYAARAYLALLDLGIAEARDVSSISKVPQAKIYHVLEQLHEKGLVVILPEFPKKYAPVPFAEYLDRLYDEHTKAAQGIESERDDLTEMFRVMGDTDVGNRGFFTVIRGRRNVLSRIEEMLAGAKRDLLFLATAGSVARAQHLAGELARARERGLRPRVLAPIDASTLGPLGRVAELADVRARDLVEEEQSRKVAIVVADGARAFLIHFVPDDANLYAGKDIGVFTDQEAMVAAILAIVEPHWTRAPGYAARSRELREGREPDFTRVYAAHAEADAAVAAALARGFREARVLEGAPAAEPAALAQVLRHAGDGASVRAILHVADLAAADACLALCAGRPDAEVRHAAPRFVARKLVLDAREAFFSVGSSDLVVHTNAPAAVAALSAGFDRSWEAAAPLATRRREVELFPHLQPGDLGLGALFYAIDDAVVVTDRDGRVVLWSPSAARLLRREASEALSLRLPDVVDEAHAEALGRAIRRAGAAGEDDRRLVETRCALPGGGDVDVEWSVSALPPGRAHVLAVGRDVTAQRRAREAELRAQVRIVHAYERMTDAFFALDRDFRIVYRNPVTRRLQRDRSDEEIDGRVLWEAYPDLKQTRFYAEYQRAMRDMVPVHFEEYYSGMKRWFEVSAYPSEDGLTVYFRDVTARKGGVPVLDRDAEPAPARLG